MSVASIGAEIVKSHSKLEIEKKKIAPVSLENIKLLHSKLWPKYHPQHVATPHNAHLCAIPGKSTGF